MTHDPPDILLSQASEFISLRTGLYFPEERWEDLKRGIKSAALELGYDDTAVFIHWLLSTTSTKKQLDTLVGYLTIGETFFFRDKSLFRVLQNQILPELISARRGAEKTVRFWSAGCCTGEEPYSIAMLIEQVMWDWRDWKITILATDINDGFLKKAKTGIYTPWSLRDTSERIIEKYFKKREKDRFEISPHLKTMVRFFQLNLVEQGYPSQLNDTDGMDLIFCRNVLMYFAPALRVQVIKRLVHSLSEGGWLVVSPTEVPFIKHPGLHPVRFPGAILFQKRPPGKKSADRVKLQPERKPSFFYKTIDQGGLPISAETPAKSLGESPPPPMSVQGKTQSERAQEDKYGIPEEEVYQGAFKLYEKGQYEETVKRLTELLSHDRKRAAVSHFKPASMALLSRAFANLGKLDKARTWGSLAVNSEKLNPYYYYLLATICLEQGDLKESMKLFKQALYLDPEFVLAHFALGNLTQQEGKLSESKKHLQNVLSLLKSMGPENIVPHSDGITAGWLAEVVKSTINKEQLV